MSLTTRMWDGSCSVRTGGPEIDSHDGAVAESASLAVLDELAGRPPERTRTNCCIGVFGCGAGMDTFVPSREPAVRQLPRMPQTRGGPPTGRSTAMRPSIKAASLKWCAHIGTGARVFVFIGCMVGANWAIVHLGADHGPGALQTTPVGFGLSAPSGELFAGAQLTLRDLSYERVGTGRTFVVIGFSAP